MAGYEYSHVEIQIHVLVIAFHKALIATQIICTSMENMIDDSLLTAI